MKHSKVQRAQVEAAVKALRDAEESMESVAQEIGSDLRAEIDEKSEKWMDSDAGQAAEELASKFEEFSIESQADLADELLS